MVSLVAEPPGVGVHGERVVGHGLQRADQLVLVLHRIQQDLAARFAGELGPGQGHMAAFSAARWKCSWSRNMTQRARAAFAACRGVQQLVQVAAQRVVDRAHQRPVGPAVALDGGG
jgi:hypothetical protein